MQKSIPCSFIRGADVNVIVAAAPFFSPQIPDNCFQATVFKGGMSTKTPEAIQYSRIPTSTAGLSSLLQEVITGKRRAITIRFMVVFLFKGG